MQSICTKKKSCIFALKIILCLYQTEYKSTSYAKYKIFLHPLPHP